MTSIYKGITVPDLTDPPNSPAQMRALVDSGGAVPRFATLAEANAAYPAGQRPVGMIVAIGGMFYTSDGTNFVSPIQGGGVPIYATNAARDAAIPSPTVGQMCVVTDFPWSPLMYGKAESTGANAWIGTMATGFLITSNGSGEFILNWPKRPSGANAFTGVPIVSGFMDLASGGAWVVTYGIAPSYPNAAGAVVGARDSQGGGTSPRANAACRANYYVTGPA